MAKYVKYLLLDQIHLYKFMLKTFMYNFSIRLYASQIYIKLIRIILSVPRLVNKFYHHYVVIITNYILSEMVE